MAGFIVNLAGGWDSVDLCFQHGGYGTNLKVPDRRWRDSQEGTFADFASMRSGDAVFFFAERKVYGIGKLASLANRGCAFQNFPDAGQASAISYAAIKGKCLLDTGRGSELQRWVCFFEPDPQFFTEGVDMDEVLSSDPPAFRRLPFMQGVSFIGCDDREEDAIRSILLRRNKGSLGTPPARGYRATHKKALQLIAAGGYELAVRPLIQAAASGKKVRHEMALEAGVIFQLARRDPNTVAAFGLWDYLAHQVDASPFKPRKWTDKIDIFGYSLLPSQSVIDRFLVIEIKAGKAEKDDVAQTMRYVDWICAQRAGRDYNMLRAYLVARSFDRTALDSLKDLRQRGFTIGSRPALSETWSALDLVEYEHVGAGQLKFNVL